VSVAAGESWHDWVRHALAQGWHGLENLALIPGTVGAAPVQNIGAYGVELKDHVDHVEAWDTVSRTWLRLGAAECRFGYRDSIFKHELAGRAIITRVAFRLSTRPDVRCAYADLQRELASRGIAEPTPQDVFDAVCAVRRAKLPDPAVLGNAGSFFRNPVLSAADAARLLAAHPDAPHYPAHDGSVKFAAAWLIDQGGWKGRRIGDAGVHERQALVLVNHGQASAARTARLARAIQDDVRNRYGRQPGTRTAHPARIGLTRSVARCRPADAAPAACLQTGGRSGFEFAAGSRPFIVNGADHRLADATTQRTAARGRVIGAVHAGDRWVEFVIQTCRDAPSLRFTVGRMEVDPKTGAAGAARHAVE
jgi:UDP-N-acetylmuramate dehydrogenase